MISVVFSISDQSSFCIQKPVERQFLFQNGVNEQAYKILSPLVLLLKILIPIVLKRL
jgi:hypothetical protein